MRKLWLTLVIAMSAWSLYARCACPGDKLAGTPSWAPAPLKALTFETGGDAKWAVDKTTLNHFGEKSSVLRSGAIKAGEKTWVQTSIVGNGRLSFWWKTSCQDDLDNLRFEIFKPCKDPAHCQCGKEGVTCGCVDAECDEGKHEDLEGNWEVVSGSNDWVNVVIQIKDGLDCQDVYTNGVWAGISTNEVEHILRWTYEKDYSLNRFEDCAWIDDVIWAKADGHKVMVTFDVQGGAFEGALEKRFVDKGNGKYACSAYQFAAEYEDEYCSDYWWRYYYRHHEDSNGNWIVDADFPTNEIKKAGFVFCGWYMNVEDVDSEINQWREVSPTNLTLYAKWCPIESDKGMTLYKVLDLDEHPDKAQRAVFEATTVTNANGEGWIALAKGGIDDGDVAMSSVMGYSSTFETVVSNLNNSAYGTTGKLNFWWKFTENYRDFYVNVTACRGGYFLGGEVETWNAESNDWVKVAGYKTGFVRDVTPKEYPVSAFARSTYVDPKGEEDNPYAGWWNFSYDFCQPEEDPRWGADLVWDGTFHWTGADGLTEYRTEGTNILIRSTALKFEFEFSAWMNPNNYVLVDEMTWTPVPEVKVTFDAQGGTVNGKATYERSYAPDYRFGVTDPEADEELLSGDFVTNKLVGSTFKGWFTEPFGGVNVIDEEYQLPVTNAVTLYAQWEISIADAIGRPKQDFVDSTCCDAGGGWTGIVGGPDGATSAVWSGPADYYQTQWFETTVTLADGVLMSFKWFKSLTDQSYNFDLFTFWVDGERMGWDLDQMTQVTRVPGYDEWDTFYYYLTAGQHTLRWEYMDKDGLDRTTGYVTDLQLAKADAKNLVEWLDTLHTYQIWLTNKLDKFAAAYTNKFESTQVDEVARARFGHAVCTVLALGENAKVLEALHDAGWGVSHQPYDYTNFLNYAFGDYANKQVIEHLESIKDESDNERYMKFANEAIAAYTAAVADLDAITNSWKGSFTIAATGKHLDNSGEAYTNDVVVDIADINMVKANFNGMLSRIQFVGAHDMTLDHDKVIETITTRPAITRTPKMSGSYMCIGDKLLKANEDNLLIDEETRARNKAYILKTYGDGSEWDIVPALPLKSAPYAEVEQSGSVQISMCGGTIVTDDRNANRLYFKIDANTVDDWNLFVGKKLVATFIDEIADMPVSVEVDLGFDWEGYQPDGNFEVFCTDYSDASASIRSEAFGRDEISVGASSIGNTLWVEVNLTQNGLGEYAEYHPLHWTIFSVQVLDDNGVYDRGRDVVVSETVAPSMTGNADDWKRVKTYSISDGGIAEAFQCARNGTNVYLRLTGLVPKFDHTFESLLVELSGEDGDFYDYVDTEKVVFAGDSVEICFVLPDMFDAESVKQLRIGSVACACSADDDEHPWWNEVYPYADVSGDISEDMRWHSVLTHYEDITAVLKEQPDFLKNIRDKGLLGDAKEAMRVALAGYLAADDGIEARKDDVLHLYEHDEERKAEIAELHIVVSNALAALDAPQKVNFALLSRALAYIRGVYEEKYLDGPSFETFIPDQMKCALQSLDFQFDGDVGIGLGKLFETGLTRAFLPQFDGCWPVLDTLPDPTFGGLFPEMTLGEWLGSYMGRGIISLDTYNEIYPHMTTKMPSQLKVRQYVNGEGYVTFTTDLREAMPYAHISCSVDGVDQAVTEFAPSHVSSGVWVKGRGEHEIVWTIVSGNLEERSLESEYWNVEYGMYWYFNTLEYGAAGYRQHSDIIPLKNVVFSEGLKLISKRRSGGSVDFGFDDDEPFVAGVATTFRGELLSDGMLAGTAIVKVDKKGVVSAEIKYADGRKASYKKGMLDSEGKVEFEGGLILTLGLNKLSGALPGETYEIVGARDVFSSKDAEDKAKVSEALAKWQKTYVLAMEAIDPEKGPMANGFATFSIAVGKSGKSKVQGYLPDGTKVSYSGQLILGEKDAHLPLAVTLKKSGNFGMDVAFGEDAAVSVAGSTGWMFATGAVIDWSLAASGLAEVAAPTAGQNAFMLANDFAFAMNCCTNALPTELRPEVVMSTGDKLSVEKAAKVIYAGDWMIDTSKGSNLSSLKLSYKAATGALGGSFKVYVLENMKMKALKATVNGVSIDGVGYGSAVIKNYGSAPVTMYLMIED